jgi:CheY-like chemotaxis protein
MLPDDGKPKTVLVVDHSVSNLFTFKQLLTKAGYHVLTAAGADLALARLCAEAPDVVVTEVIMPGTDGYALCRAIKSDPSTAHIPVIMMGELDASLDGYWRDRAGASRYVTKSDDADVLLGALAEIES